MSLPDPKRTEPAEAFIERLINEANRYLGPDQMPLSQVADVDVVDARHVIAVTQQIAERLAEILVAAKAEPTARSVMRDFYIRHVERRFTDVCFDLWRLTDQGPGEPADDLLHYCLESFPEYRAAIDRHRADPLDEEQMLQAALYCQQAVSAVRQVVMEDVHLLPSRLHTDELFVRDWMTELPASVLSVEGAVFAFEAPLHLTYARRPSPDAVTATLARHVGAKVLQFKPDADLESLAVSLDGVTLQGLTATDETAMSLMLRYDYVTNPDDEGKFMRIIDFDTTLVCVPRGCELDRLAVNLQQVLEHGQFRPGEGPGNDVRLSDHSAMHLGRAMAGRAPLSAREWGLS